MNRSTFQGRPRGRLRPRGFTLVELMIVVAIIGVLAALAIYGVRRYLASAKTSEAKNLVGAIARNGQVAFERESTSSQLIGEGGQSVVSNHEVCLSATNPVPQNAPPLGTKYQPDSTADFEFSDAAGMRQGWKCLGFSVTHPIYYQYNYNAGGGYVTDAADPAGTQAFEAAALGDIDGDTLRSQFSRTGEVNVATGTMKLSTQVFVQDEFE